MSYNENLISDQIDGGLQAERDLRDHFAGLAMQGEITRCVSGYNFEDTARTAYMMADAMLKARKEVKP